MYKRMPSNAATKRPSYWRAVRWLILNDGSVTDALKGLKNDPNQAITRAALKDQVIVGFLADMYGMDPNWVALDIIRTSCDYPETQS